MYYSLMQDIRKHKILNLLELLSIDKVYMHLVRLFFIYWLHLKGLKITFIRNEAFYNVLENCFIHQFCLVKKY